MWCEHIWDLRTTPTGTHFLQQDHTYPNRAIPRNSAVVWGPACWGICSHPVPHSQQVPEKINHTEISISYKADWPIRSGFLLVLITYINPLSLSMLATWLSTFLSMAAHMLPLQWPGQEWRGSFLLPRILPVYLLHPYFLSGFPAYTACLTNQRFIKIWLTEYRPFSHTTVQQ